MAEITSALETGLAARLAARAKTLTTPTSGIAPSYLQANLIVLPFRYAADFRLLCARNPVPCPLLAESAAPGVFDALTSHTRVVSPSSSSSAPIPIAADIDLRHDAPRYRVYRDGRLVDETGEIETAWTSDHVGFLIGCSYSFETALARAGLPPRHAMQGRNVPMYRTAVPLCPAGAFTGATLVVSMRPYRARDVSRVRDLTRPFVTTHGEPVDWGWEALRRLGIKDLADVQWGERPVGLDGTTPFGPGVDSEGEEGEGGDYVPVFWGCGVTPQEAVMRAELEGTVMAHAPGHMIVLDVRDYEVFPTMAGGE